jgi:phasin family protein
MNEQFTNMLKGMFPMAPLSANDAHMSGLNMFPANEQLANLVRSNLEAQISAATVLTGTAVDSLQKIVELNMNAARATLEDSTAVAKQLLSARDVQEFMSLSVSQAQPAVAKALSYGRHLSGIASAAQESLSRATRDQMAETNNRMHEMADDANRTAPATPGNVMDMMQMAFNTASANYQHFNRTAQQAAEAAQANLATALNQFTQAADRSVTTSGRAGR